jgi:hypothetical protein
MGAGKSRKPFLPRARRWGFVVLAAALAIPVATVLGAGEATYLKEQDTSCWPCHVGWPDPLKTFYNVLPPPEAGAPVGEEFDYVVQVQNPWLQAITYIEPSLSLAAAPSLQFAGGPEPIQGVDIPGSITLSPTALPGLPGQAGASSDVVVAIPLGVTFVEIVLAPQDTSQTGPTLTLAVLSPSGAQVFNATAAGPGQPVSLVAATAQEVAALGGAGNWTVRAAVTDPSRIGVPRFNTIPFTVTLSARAETQDVTTLIQPQNVNIAKRSSFLFTYRLRAAAEPQAGETVGLVLNATMFYQHIDKATDDHANVTKAYDKGLSVSLAPDGRVVVLAPDDAGFVVVQPSNGATLDTLSEAVGYASALLLVSSVWTGGMFGKASRRQLNAIFGSAKRRVAFHNFLSYGIILFAAVHTVLFIVETAYYWTLGVLWGGLALLAMLGLGLTGAFQVGMIRRWSYGAWRWSHYGLAIAAIVFTLVHMALDGVHFGFVQDAIGWDDPLDPRSVTK